MATRGMSTTVLAAQDLRKSFGGVQAVRGVSFAVAAGEMLALIGPNGAGKSTCFNMLGGQLHPDGGRVLLQDRDISFMAPRRVSRLGVGRTFQITATFASMTVRENVQMALLSHHGEAWRLWRAARHLRCAEARALLEQVGMAPQAERAACVLAYGDLKRLELAMALAGAPRLLLMDEPTAGMAPDARVALMTLTQRLASERGVAVLFTEHDMDIVFGVANRILVLDHGELIAQGDPASIRADARVRAVYLGGVDAERR
jgi:branched-chain amino acid transport system ATP-binding protein